jgi:uncharacterized membrane protein YqjE
MAEPRDDRSLGELLGTLTTQLGQLIHKEVELARTEITANALRAGRNASLVGAGGIVVHAGFLALVATVILVLVSVFDLDPAVAALLVTIVLFTVGGALIMRGRSQLEADNLAPTRTIETLKEDAEWAREQTR